MGNPSKYLKYFELDERENPQEDADTISSEPLPFEDLAMAVLRKKVQFIVLCHLLVIKTIIEFEMVAYLNEKLFDPMRLPSENTLT